jgi:nucleoid-associated protein YgaU
MSAGSPSRWRLVLWLVVLVTMLVVLQALGAGAAGVPLASTDAFSAWVESTPPPLMALAALRLAALAGGWYLVASTTLLLFSLPLRRPRLSAVAGSLSPPLVRRLLLGGGGIGLATGALLGALPSMTLTAAPAVAAAEPSPERASSTAPTTPTATMTRLGGVDSGGATPGDPGSATMTRLPPEPSDAVRPVVEPRPTIASPRGSHATPPSRPVDRVPAAPAAGASGLEPAAVFAAGGAATWLVDSGDSFWSIAADVLTPPGGPSPSDRAVARYWRRLVDANRRRLVDPRNPDLLRPGQELVVPDPR